MKATEIIDAIRIAKGWSKATLGRACGFVVEQENVDKKQLSKATDVINKRLKQKSIDIGIVAEMADKMDYQVVIIPKGVTLRSDWYAVDAKEKKEEVAENE